MSSADASTTVTFAPTPRGCCIRVRGRGTANHSRGIRDAAKRVMASDPPASVVLDLYDCVYADSTFLGCMLELHRAGGQQGLFTVAAPPERRAKLFGAMRLDRLIRCIEIAPDVCGPWVELPASSLGDADTTQHVMECHRLLSEIDSPMQAVFARIAEQMRRELEARA